MKIFTFSMMMKKATQYLQNIILVSIWEETQCKGEVEKEEKLRRHDNNNTLFISALLSLSLSPLRHLPRAIKQLICCVQIQHAMFGECNETSLSPKPWLDVYDRRNSFDRKMWFFSIFFFHRGSPSFRLILSDSFTVTFDVFINVQ